MSGTRLVAAIVGGLVVIALLVGIGLTVHRGQDSSPSRPLVDGGRWPEGERTAFIDSCVKSCRASPGVTPERYAVCDTACKCAADEGEKIVSARELTELVTAIQGGKPTPEQSDKLQKMKAAGATCATQSGGLK